MESDSDSKRRLEGIVASAMDAIITIDEQNRIVLFNPAAERMFGVPAPEALGHSISRFIPERFRGLHDQHIERFRDAGVTDRRMGALGAVSGLRSNGVEFPLEASISQVEVGGERLATVILRDITERKGAEDALRESRRRMEGIVESAMDAIITVDQQQRVILFNPAAERMFGVAAEQALGQPITNFIPERYRATHDAHIRRFREAGVTNRRMGALGAVSGLRADGEEFPVEASISQVEVGGEQLATVILRDITERKLNEEARLLLAREVDHRAKNALAVAQSLVKLTKAASQEAYVDAVQGRIAALARAHSLLSKSSWQGADLAQTVGDELAAYAKPGQTIVSGPPVMLLANAVQPVSLLVHELATNAFKYGALRHERGQVKVAWTHDTQGALRISWIERGGPPVSLPARAGFGSTLLREVITRQLGGELDIDWAQEGVRVDLSLAPDMFRIGRAARSAVQEGLALAEPAPTSHHPDRRVLIVEDESLVAMELAEELDRGGWRIAGPAYTLAEAFRIVEEDPDISAAVLDVNLAGRAVYPLAEMLRTRGLPFVFCTGYEMVDPDGRFPEAPVLRKPVNTDLLRRALEVQLRRSATVAPA